MFNDDLLASFFCTPAGVASMVLTLAFNAFIFGITVVQTYWHTVEMRKYGQTSVTEILLRDGKQLFSLTVNHGSSDQVCRDPLFSVSYSSHI